MNSSWVGKKCDQQNKNERTGIGMATPKQLAGFLACMARGPEAGDSGRSGWCTAKKNLNDEMKDDLL